MQPLLLTGRRWRSSLPPAAGPWPVRASGTWAWPKWPISGTSLTSRCVTVTEGVAICRQFSYTQPLAAGLATLAWIRQATGDPAGAREAIGEARQAAPGPAGVLNPVPAQRAGCCWPKGTWPGPPAG